MNEIVEIQPIPWQRRREIGFLKALWDTIKQVLFKPVEFFDNLEIRDSYLEPFFFYFIVIAVATIISQIAGLFLMKILLNIILPSKQILPLGLILRGFTVSLIPIIISATIGGFVLSGIIHLFVMLFKREKSFIDTFNVVAYSAAASIFIIIPVVGMIISLVWICLIVIRGLERVHKFSIRKAVVACLCPVVLLFGIGIAVRSPNIPKLKTNAVKARVAANEAAVRANCMEIVAACEAYRRDYDFYPSSLADLADSKPPYIDRDLAKGVSPASAIKGYYYVYKLIDESHFCLYAKSIIKGHQEFFVDQTPVLRLRGIDGPPVR